MTATSQQLQEWLTAKEDEHLEFKEAKANFHFDKLVKYCACARKRRRRFDHPGRDRQTTPPCGRQRGVRGIGANQGRADRQAETPHRSQGDRSPRRPCAGLHRAVGPIGVPVAVEGAYWMRAGKTSPR